MNAVLTYSLHGVESECVYLDLFQCFEIFIHQFCSCEPNKQETGCNLVSVNDSANFLSFLQMLRSQDGAQNLVIYLCCSTHHTLS